MTRGDVRKWYDSYLGKLIPRYAFFSLISCFAVNSMIYWGTQRLMAKAYHYDLSTAFDKWLPFRAEWVFIYLVCYIFWGANYILIGRQGKEHWYRFAVADMLSRVICGIFFIVLPTTNVRPEITGNDVFSSLMQLVYQLDSPTDLFPSIHCLVSWFCYIGIRRRKGISKKYQIFSCVFALLVFASTQFTKQHYILDMVSAVMIAEGCYFLSHHVNWYRGLEKIFQKVDRIVFGENNDW